MSCESSGIAGDASKSLHAKPHHSSPKEDRGYTRQVKVFQGCFFFNNPSTETMFFFLLQTDDCRFLHCCCRGVDSAGTSPRNNSSSDFLPFSGFYRSAFLGKRTLGSPRVLVCDVSAGVLRSLRWGQGASVSVKFLGDESVFPVLPCISTVKSLSSRPTSTAPPLRPPVSVRALPSRSVSAGALSCPTVLVARRSSFGVALRCPFHAAAGAFRCSRGKHVSILCFY